MPYLYPMNKRFGKTEKLKHRKDIERLFAEGKSLKKFPVKLVFYPLPTASIHKVGVSVPKRHFKRAVDRNRLKRLLRESYRLQKDILSENIPPHALMFIYTGKEKTDFHTIKEIVAQLLYDFVKQVETNR